MGASTLSSAAAWDNPERGVFDPCRREKHRPKPSPLKAQKRVFGLLV
jgi:hypothetical protein